MTTRKKKGPNIAKRGKKAWPARRSTYWKKTKGKSLVGKGDQGGTGKKRDSLKGDIEGGGVHRKPDSQKGAR